MLTLLRWFFLLLAGLMLFIGLTPPIQRKLNDKGLIPNQFTYGDLYNMTNLPAFKEENIGEHMALTPQDKPAHHYKNVHFYNFGDSFTDIDTSYYAGGFNFRASQNERLQPIHLDRSKKNILFFQFIERVIRERLQPAVYPGMYIENGIMDTTGKGPLPAKPLNSKPSPLPEWALAQFGHDMSSRLEFILFNFTPFLKLKEAKAQFTLDVLGRVPAAEVSRDHKHVFYRIEANGLSSSSSFYPADQTELKRVVRVLNTMRDYYKKMGFDEMYVAFIPNKVTVLEPNHRPYGQPYNHLIERLEADTTLKTPLLSFYGTVTKHPEWYHLGDGHWNNQGKRYWLKRVNSLIGQVSRGDSIPRIQY